jgi:transcriptional regulator with XRE-family HTH domain
MSQLGLYIVRRRAQLGWTRADLARKADIPYSTLQYIEEHKPSKKPVKPQEETLRKIATALGEEDDSQLRILAGYDVKMSADISERAKRIDALLTVAPRWGAALLSVQDLSEAEQDQALTVLEVHLELVKRRKKARLN